MAAIITTHMPRNDAAAASQLCPGIRIQAIDIDHPPGIGIWPISDIELHQTIVTATLAVNSSAETAKKACWEARSEAMGLKISCSPVVTVMFMAWISGWCPRRGGATTFPPSRPA